MNKLTSSNANKILVFDTETTDLIRKDESGNRIFGYVIQLSFIGYDIEKETIEYNEDLIINLPQHVKITEESIALHGINREISNKGIEMKNALKIFKNALEWCECLVAHNMYYDKTMIMEECHRNNYSKKMNFNRNKKGNYIPEYCTMKHGTNLCKIEKYNQKNNTTYFKYPKLEELYRHLFNEEPTGMHNAFVDILLTIKCYLKMTRDVESNEINKLLLHFNQAY